MSRGAERDRGGREVKVADETEEEEEEEEKEEPSGMADILIATTYSLLPGLGVWLGSYIEALPGLPISCQRVVQAS